MCTKMIDIIVNRKVILWPFNSPEKMLDDPQALNLYAYSRNNPLRYVDPDGESIREFLLSGTFQLGLSTTQKGINVTGNFLTFGQFEPAFKHSDKAADRATQEGVNFKTLTQGVGDIVLGVGRSSVGALATGGALGEIKLFLGPSVQYGSDKINYYSKSSYIKKVEMNV